MAIFHRIAVLAALLSPSIATARASLYEEPAAIVLPPQELAQTTAEPTSAPKITPEQASAAALKVVPGHVTSVVIEKKRGTNVYVVEIRTRGGGEKDVFVDLMTGQVLGTED